MIDYFCLSKKVSIAYFIDTIYMFIIKSSITMLRDFFDPASHNCNEWIIEFYVLLFSYKM